MKAKEEPEGRLTRRTHETEKRHSDFAQLFSSPPNKDDRGGIGDAHSVKRKRESEEKEVSDESGRSVASNKQQQQQQQHFKGNQRGTCPPRRGHTQQQMPHHSGCAVQRVQNQGAGARAGAVVPEGRGPHWGKEPAMKDMEKRGQEIPKKSKKKKGKKQDNRGEGRQQRWRGTANGPPSFAKKQPYLSQEFISQHAIERDGRLFCKFFLSGRCIKEEACKFEHEFVVPDKKQELCKFYVFGFCTKGADCIYMHSDYPCKFFHTGTKCYQGDHCKFSHDPLTEVTRSLLEKVLNKNEEDEGKQENLVPSDTSPPPLSADSKPVQLGLRPNFYNSSSLVSGPPLPSVSSVTADKPAESLFPPLPPLEPLNSPSSSPHPAVPPGGSDSEGQKREAEVGHLQPIAVQGGSTCEEPDTEAGPKDTPVLIPLDLLPGVALKDPRRPNQTLSELTLSWPTFARTVDSLHRYKPLCCAPLLNTSTQEAPTANPDDETRDPSGTTEGQSLTTGPVDPPAAPPGRDGDVQYAESIAAPAVHNLPVPSLATWGRQAHTAPSDAGTQAKTSTVFRDMFKTPLPLLSSSDSTA